MKTKKFLLFIISSVFLVLGNSCVSDNERGRPPMGSDYREASNWNSDPYVPKVDKRPSSYYFSGFDNRGKAASYNYDNMDRSSVHHTRHCEDKDDYSTDHKCYERERTDYSPPGGIPDWVKKK